MEKKINDAVELFQSGFSCSQAVLAVFCEEFGLDKNTANMLSTSFAGGMGGKGYTCGAVTGAYMVIGLKYGRITADDTSAKMKTYEVIKEFDKRFKLEYEHTTCGSLIGFEPENEEQKLAKKEDKTFENKCYKFVETSVKILSELL